MKNTHALFDRVSFGGTSYEKLQDIANSSFISCFASVFTSPDVIFYNFSELDSKLSKKIFSSQISHFNIVYKTLQHDSIA